MLLKLEKACFNDSWGYRFEVILSKFFGSSDPEIFHEISIQETLQQQLSRSATLGAYSEPSQFAKIVNDLTKFIYFAKISIRVGGLSMGMGSASVLCR